MKTRFSASDHPFYRFLKIKVYIYIFILGQSYSFLISRAICADRKWMAKEILRATRE